jgi:RecA/RadA recombinase
MDFLKDIVKEIGDDYTKLAGESSTGKTFFSLAVVKNFLDSNPDGYCLYFDTEAAVNKSLLDSRGIDLTRLVVVNVVTVEEFRSKALKAVDIYLKKSEDERKPCMFVLDSLGMLSTEKEITDALNDKQVRDMTKSQLIKGAFRMLTLKLGQANIPMIVTNHTYDVIGAYVPTKEMGGGSGLKYAASTIIHLSKKKEKDGTEIGTKMLRYVCFTMSVVLIVITVFLSSVKLAVSGRTSQDATRLTAKKSMLKQFSKSPKLISHLK